MAKQATLLKHNDVPLEEEIAECDKCSLHKNRTNTVPGEGDPDADIVIIGEAPGENEDIDGRPFVGRAGDVLNKLLNSQNISRKDVFITNIIKCRPPDNRDPKKEEKEVCLPYLDEQLDVIGPDVIITLGKHATESLVDHEFKEVRGQEVEWKGRVLVPLYHPAATLYDPSLKTELEENFGDVISDG